MSVLLLLVPIVGVVCGGLLWPLITETLTEGVGRPSNAGSTLEVTATLSQPGLSMAPSVSVSDCGYTTVIHDTLITATGLECDARDPWTAHQFVTTAEEIRRL